MDGRGASAPAEKGDSQEGLQIEFVNYAGAVCSFPLSNPGWLRPRTPPHISESYSDAVPNSDQAASRADSGQFVGLS